MNGDTTGADHRGKRGWSRGNWRANGDTIGADHRGKGVGAGTQACKLTSLEVVLLWRARSKDTY